MKTIAKIALVATGSVLLAGCVEDDMYYSNSPPAHFKTKTTVVTKRYYGQPAATGFETGGAPAATGFETGGVRAATGSGYQVQEVPHAPASTGYQTGGSEEPASSTGFETN